jgi:GDP-mannose 6-dehydrogenase
MRGTIDEVLEHAEVLVIGNRAEEFRRAINGLRPGQLIIDLVRIFDKRASDETYHGICW